MSQVKPLIGISACLAGEPVRYDEEDVHNFDLVRDLQKHFEVITICPEVVIGLSVPREPIHLAEGGRVMDSTWTKDYSKDLAKVATGFRVQHAGLKAFVFKSGSPSCGLGSANVKNDQFEVLSESGDGAFAKKLVEQSGIIFAEDTSLVSAVDRQEFISRVLMLGK